MRLRHGPPTLGKDSIRPVDPSGNISTFAGPGPFESPIGIAIDTTGDIYLGARGARVIRKIDASGVVTTIAGDRPAWRQRRREAAATAAKLSTREAIAVDAAGNVYFVDADNSYRIRRIDADGTITTVAGNGKSATAGDGGPATEASLDNAQEGLVVSPAGDLYVSTGQRIRHIDAQGNIRPRHRKHGAGHRTPVR